MYSPIPAGMRKQRRRLVFFCVQQYNTPIEVIFVEEMLDLFDAQGNPTGITIRRGEEAPQGMYWPVVDVWIVNSKGELLIQQRDYAKPNWPGYWCESAGGAVVSGEDFDTAALRETQEEIGLTVDFTRGGKVFEYLGEHSLKHVYLFCQDADLSQLTCQPGEVIALRYATPDEIRALIRSGEMVPLGYTSQLLTMLPILTSMYRKAD